MTEPAFLVEGHMEQRIIQRLCPGKTVRRIGCNGDSVSMTAVAKALTVHMRMLEKFHPIVILLDRERREESCEILVEELGALLDKKNYAGRYVIGIADRTIENWILSDWDHIVESNRSYKQICCEIQGAHGKSIIRGLMPTGLVYHETTVGVELFTRCRPNKIFSANESFRSFVSRLRLQCWWLAQIDSRFNQEAWINPACSSEAV